MRRTIFNRVFGVLLAALFLSHYAGSTLFVHTHNTSAGSVTHSHPYLPSSVHGHSAAGFAAIDALTSLWFCAAAGTTLSLFVAFVRVDRVERSSATRAKRLKWSPLRGPPVVC